MSKSLKKIVEESRDKSLPEVEMCDRGISNMLDIPGLCKPLWDYVGLPVLRDVKHIQGCF